MMIIVVGAMASQFPSGGEGGGLFSSFTKGLSVLALLLNILVHL